MRRHRATAALLALALLAASCGDDGGRREASGDCPVGALDDADGPVEITLWHTQVGLTQETLIALADDYNATQDAVRLTVDNQGDAVEELVRKYRQAIPSNDLPALAMFDDTSTRFLADSGTIVPAGVCAEAAGYQDYEEDFLPALIDHYSIDGVLQAGSIYPNARLLYYNRDHFAAAGLDPDDPPTTLEEVQEAARAIRDAGIVEQPFVLNLAPFLLEHWTTGAGAGIVDNENGRGPGETAAGTLDNAVTPEVLGLLDEMNDEGLLNPVPGVEGQFDHFFAMGLEQASMTVESSLAVTTINAVLEGNLDPADLGLDSELPPIDVNLDAGEFPGHEEPGRGQVGGFVLYMTNTGSPQEQAAAWDFITWVNRLENQLRWTLEGSFLPARRSVLDEPALQEEWETTRSGRWLAIAYDQLTELEPDWPGPLIGPYTEVRTAIRDAFDEVMYADSAVADALATADARITEALADYNNQSF